MMGVGENDGLLVGDRDQWVATSLDRVTDPEILGAVAYSGQTIMRRPAVHPDPEPMSALAAFFQGPLWEFFNRALPIAVVVGICYFVARLAYPHAFSTPAP